MSYPTLRAVTSVTWNMKMVMEKSRNMKTWPKVMAFCDQSWSFTNFAHRFYQICMFFVTAKKLSSNLESHGREKVMETYFVKYVGTLASEV